MQDEGLRTWRTAAIVALLAAVLIVAPAFAKVKNGTHDGDRIVGGPKADTLDGRHGNDKLNGRGGGDLLIGGNGADELTGGSGFDELRGGGGDDVIDARDGEPDLITCGRATDRVLVDEVEDGVFDCEEVVEP